MTNETMKTNDLETVLERLVRRMDERCFYLLEFWKRNNISFSGRSNECQAFFNYFLGSIDTLSNVGLFETDDSNAARDYLNVFMSQLNEAVRDAVSGC